VLGALPAIIDHPAVEAIKLISASGDPLIGRYLTFDALEISFRETSLRVDPTNTITFATVIRSRWSSSMGCAPRSAGPAGRLSTGDRATSSWMTANHSPPHTPRERMRSTIIGSGMGGVQIIFGGQKFGPSGRPSRA